MEMKKRLFGKQNLIFLIALSKVSMFLKIFGFFYKKNKLSFFFFVIVL